MAYFQLLRPQQWIKNLFVFAGLIFGQKLGDSAAVVATLLGFVCLSLVSSAVYVLNDIHDRAEDRLHPRKRNRPIASGTVSVPAALALFSLVLVVGLGGSWRLDSGFFVVVTVYFALQLGYTFGFKHVVLLDVIVIGLGFVLRAIAGAVLVHVEISHWLVLCTFTLCLFLGFSKRRCELNAMAENGGGEAHAHRRTLAIYTKDLLNHMTTLTAGIAVVSFMLYATDDRTTLVFKSNLLIYTIPFVVYAIFRFAVLVEHGWVDGPTEVVMRDRPFQLAIVLWVASTLLVIYRGPQLTTWARGLLGSPP